MMTTRSEPSSRTMVRATRVLPDPEPPAMPIRMRRPVITRATVASARSEGNARARPAPRARAHGGTDDGGRSQEAERGRDPTGVDGARGMECGGREAAPELRVP